MKYSEKMTAAINGLIEFINANGSYFQVREGTFWLGYSRDVKGILQHEGLAINAVSSHLHDRVADIISSAAATAGLNDETIDADDENFSNEWIYSVMSEIGDAALIDFPELEEVEDDE